MLFRSGTHEDHARHFPTVWSLITKIFGRKPSVRPEDGETMFYPDWVAGMFMLSQLNTFRALGGFDERYFLYYEDVDLCARARAKGLQIAVNTESSVVHAARRASRRDPRHALLHISSGLRYVLSHPIWALGIRSNKAVNG